LTKILTRLEIFTNGKVELANLGDAAIGRITLEPGWK
jgi:hypothetical protein